MVRKPVICGRPLKIVGDTADSYFTDLLDGQPFADDVTMLLSRIVEADWVAIDVGANIGLETLALSLLAPKGYVHAFEPVPRTARYLRTNVERNGACNVEVHETAVGASVGELQFLDNTEFAAGSMALDSAAPLLRQYYGSTRSADAFISVPCTTLDEFVRARALERLDLIKIDAEGFDIEVIAGAEQTLTRFRPCVIMEFASYGLTMHRNMLPQDALARVRTIFDRVFVIEPGTGWLREIVTDVDACDLLYENAMSRPVQDLLCAFERSASLERALAVERASRRLEQEVADLRANIARLEHANRRLEHEVAELRANIARLESSKSWQITAPLRRLRQLTQGRTSGFRPID